MRVEFDDEALAAALGEVTALERKRSESAARADLRSRSWADVMREKGWKGLQKLDDLLESDQTEPKLQANIAKFLVTQSPQQVEALPQDVKLTVDLAGAVRAAAEVAARLPRPQVVDVKAIES